MGKPRRDDLSPVMVGRVAEIVAERAGLTFDAARRPVLEAGVRACLARSGSDESEYVERLQEESARLDDLLAEITVGETYFFRDHEIFDLLRERVLPELCIRPREAGAPIRIWSAGCASGEEPYSLAILLHQLGWLDRASVLGTDISRRALRQAREARYTKWSLRGVQPGLVEEYFAESSGRLTLSPPIRDAVEFRYLNLAGPGYPSATSGMYGMDLILCRNVLLYIAPERGREIGIRLAGTLAEGGWLLLGAADPLLTDVPGLTAEVTPAGLVYRHTSTRPRQREMTAPTSPSSSPRHPEPTAVVTSTPPADPPRVGTVPVGRTPAEPGAEIIPATAASSSAVPPGHEPARVVAAVKAEIKAGALNHAEALCRLARERFPLSPEIAVLHAFLTLETEGPIAAMTAARRAVYLDPESPAAYLALGAALVRLRNVPGARRAFRNAERLLNAMTPDTPVASPDDAAAGQLSELARTQLARLDHDRPSAGASATARPDA